MRSRWARAVGHGSAVSTLGFGALGVGAADAQPAPGVIGFGNAPSYGAPTAGQLNGSVTGIAADPATGLSAAAFDSTDGGRMWAPPKNQLHQAKKTRTPPGLTTLHRTTPYQSSMSHHLASYAPTPTSSAVKMR